MNEMRKLMEAIEQVSEYGHRTHPDVRKYTNKLHELMDEGSMDPREVADAALTYMSESEVADMIRANDWAYGMEDEDENEFEESVEVVGEEDTSSSNDGVYMRIDRNWGEQYYILKQVGPKEWFIQHIYKSGRRIGTPGVTSQKSAQSIFKNYKRVGDVPGKFQNLGNTDKLRRVN